MITEPGSAMVAEPGSVMIVQLASNLAVPPNNRCHNPFVTGLLFKNLHPWFHGTGRYKRSNTRTTQSSGDSSDSGLSGSDSDDSDREEEDKNEDFVNTVGSQEVQGEFSGPLPSDEVQVRYDGESIEIELGAYISEG